MTLSPRVVLLVVCVLGFLVFPTSGLAQTATAPPLTNQIARGISGPFDITVLANPTSPIAGLGTRVSVRVLNAADGTPVTDAQVSTVANRPDGETTGEVAIPRRPGTPEFYEALLTLKTAGKWNFTFVVKDARGLGTVDTVIAVQPQVTSGNTGTIIWAVAMVVIMAGAGLAYWTMRRPRGRKAS